MVWYGILPLSRKVDLTFTTEFCTLANRQFNGNSMGVDTLWFAIKRLQSEDNEDYRFPTKVKLRAGRCAEGGKDHIVEQLLIDTGEMGIVKNTFFRHSCL